MKDNTLLPYEAPCVDILEVEVEQGFALSDTEFDDGVDQETGDLQDMFWDTSW